MRGAPVAPTPRRPPVGGSLGSRFLWGGEPCGSAGKPASACLELLYAGVAFRACGPQTARLLLRSLRSLAVGGSPLLALRAGPSGACAGALGGLWPPPSRLRARAAAGLAAAGDPPCAASLSAHACLMQPRARYCRHHGKIFSGLNATRQPSHRRNFVQLERHRGK